MKLSNLYNKLTKAVILTAALSTTSCLSHLDVEPIDENLSTADKVYDSEESLQSGLNKVYAGFVIGGNAQGDGDPDVAGFDGGKSVYWRQFFNLQELPTDEMKNAWAGDPELPELSRLAWGSSNASIRTLYYRIFYQITLANEFARQAKVYGGDFEETPRMIAEARFLRALAYTHALDFFGNKVPKVMEEDGVGAFLPPQFGESERGTELFDHIESELIAIQDDLLPAKANYVGQANQVAAKMLLAKLYLNHAVYRGAEEIAYFEKAKVLVNDILTSGYRLMGASDAQAGDQVSPYELNFTADNYTSDEIIFAFTVDGKYSQSWGGMTFIMNAGASAAMKEFTGVDGWGGNRTTPMLVDKFEDNDDRALWFTEGHQKEMDELMSFTDGYGVLKYKNLNRDFSKPQDHSFVFVHTDIPVFRLSDAMLMAAELEARTGGLTAEGLEWINTVRRRANTSEKTLAEVQAEGTLDFILDERARELYWEGHRRTDLIRFGKFIDGYQWSFKGGVAEGTSVNQRYELMPIPPSDLNANPNLTQNFDY
ncbi:RagB/SusD family nutrient uptake outer membrane protein [Algivirga pacifica]|uniref:RagB/SusD family nutrient uptake outer membrane protein n=1 Tax=Algivirga pacifica TaxID=1162670 RepID=A0ABP9D6Z3_9BACT